MSEYQNCSLFLIPLKADFCAPSLDDFCHALTDIGLTGNAINNEDSCHQFIVGEQYLNHIAYMGCSPAVNFEASESRPSFCSIKVKQYNEPELIYSRIQLKAPSCPQCKNVIKNWTETRTDKTLPCPHCETETPLSDIQWRKMAGYAQLFIEISDIFPKEAIPQPSLLNALSTISGTDWHYFYRCRT